MRPNPNRDADSSPGAHRFPFAPPRGARCESALPAAVFEAAPVRPSRRTLDEALAATALVFLDFVILASPLVVSVLLSVHTDWTHCQLWCTLCAVGDAPRLGRELSSARLAGKRSLRDVAGEAEISAAYLQKLERGQVDEPSPNILRRLAGVLRIDYRRLLELAGYDVPRGRAPQDHLTTRFAGADLTAAEERAVAAFIDHLVAQRER